MGVESNSRSPQIEWFLEGYVAFQSAVGSGVLAGWSLDGLQVQVFGEAHEIHALGLRAPSLPEDFLDWLVRLDGQVGLRFAEFGLRAMAQFANGSEALPWTRVQPIPKSGLPSLECQPGVKYQVDSAEQVSRRLS